MAGEFEVIDQYFAKLGGSLPAGDLGIGDDGAVLSLPDSDYQLVVVTDTLVQGIHFPINTRPFDIAWKALAVNLSDLAAMGAKPWCYSLALSVPNSMASENWFADFSAGLKALCAHLCIELPLIGGDTTSAKEGALSVTVSAKGLVEKGKAVFRSNAQIGDLVVVTDKLGQGALGLKVAFDEIKLEDVDAQLALNALNRPIPKTQLGFNFSSLVTSAIDVSDGLLQDLTHIVRQSSSGFEAGHSVSLSAQSLLGARLNLQSMPISSAMQKYVSASQDWSMVLSGGDDYQLCMTLSKACWPSLQVLAQELDVDVTVIGEVIDRPVIEVLAENGEIYRMVDLSKKNPQSGFQHF